MAENDKVLRDEMHNIGVDARKPVFGVCEQRRCRPACASVQSDQLLCYSLINIGKYHIKTCYKRISVF